jgi:hypothetical protein
MYKIILQEVLGYWITLLEYVLHRLLELASAILTRKTEEEYSQAEHDTAIKLD